MTGVLHWLNRMGPTNPLTVRVVHNGSRRWRHLMIRMVYLGLLTALMVFGLIAFGGLGSEMNLTALAKAGANVFLIVGFGQVILICLLAPLFFAGAIAQEQQAQTFDILLTTPLTNLQIVLGSLAGRLFFLLTLLASGLPLFSVLLVFGGVPVRAVAVAFVVAALVALVVGSVAVALAVFRRGGRRAVFVFVLAVAGYMLVCYGLDRGLRLSQGPLSLTSVLAQEASTAVGDGGSAAAAGVSSATQLRQAVDTGTTTWLTPLHPLLVLESSFSATYRPPSREQLADQNWLIRAYVGRPLATFTVLSVLVSGLLLSFSAVSVRRIGQSPGGGGWLAQWLRVRAGTSDQAGPRTAREVWQNPIAWQEAHTRGQRAGAILARYGFVVLATLVSVLLLLGHHLDVLPAFAGGTGGGMNSTQVFVNLLRIIVLLEVAVVVIVAIYISAGCVSREREDGTLDLLLTTPITPKYYIWGKLRGLVGWLGILLAAPVITLAMAGAYSAIGGALGWPSATYTVLPVDAVSQSIEAPLVPVEAPIVLILTLLPYTALCVAVGLAGSLKSPGVLMAVAKALLPIGLITLGVSWCGFVMSSDVPLLGPVINALSPINAVNTAIVPWENLTGFESGFSQALGTRIAILFCGIITAGFYCAIVYGVILGMVKGFDHTVRRLSGRG